MQNIGNSRHKVLENAQEGIYNSYNWITLKNDDLKTNMFTWVWVFQQGQLFQHIPFYSEMYEERWTGETMLPPIGKIE